jgi:phage shock protein PspC (stress-responsive transcriptional regulator)
MDPSRWHRNHEDARLGGVCAAVSAALAVPVSVVRLAMILFTIFLHIGPVVYFGLWLIIPPRPGEDSQLERLMRWGLELAEKSSGRRGGPPWRNEY